ncbi:MAG: transporter substrate-binding domain-containing protein [Desulfamplus sp.]|nr:transporter substrate-binding domain-containing protein [Desulfamplus sp.]
MTIFKKKIIACSLFAFLVTYTIYNQIDSQTNKLKVVYTDWFPYTYEKNGEALGFEIDILKAVLKKMNMDAEFVKYPWKRCLSNLEYGQADVLVSLLKTPEREKYTYFPDTHISISKTVFFTKRDTEINFNGSYQDLKPYSIGVIAGFSYGEVFDKADYLTKDLAHNPQMLIRKLMSGRHELAAENQAVVSGYASQMGVKDKIKFLVPPIHTQKLYVGFSKAREVKKLCDDFSKTLLEFKSTDEYGKIFEKYGIDPLDMTESIN